jgi:hypothetical protein
VCFVFHKTIEELERTILTTLFLPVQKTSTDCILYRGPKYEDLEKCPICGLGRFNRRKGSDDFENCNKNRRKGGPKKVFWYFPIIPRLKRCFANKKV